MKKFITFTTDDMSTFFYAINDVMSAKFQVQNELSMELTTKSNGVETFIFESIEDYNYAKEVFNDL